MKLLATKILMVLLGLLPLLASADGDKPVRVLLDDHEPNLLGLSYDQDDKEVFLDFKLSLEYPIADSFFQNDKSNTCAIYFTHCQPYMSFTGRFGQYLFTRHSSPVISKRFNPKLFWRLENKKGYIDLEYAHESNGQRISTLSSFNGLEIELAGQDGGKASHANDYISRGWDYIGATVKYKYRPDLTLYFSYASYIGGIFQDDIEEYYDWEPTRSITARSQVNGLRLMTKYTKKSANSTGFFDNIKLAFIYETGTDDSFENNTFQIELASNFLDMPVMFWARNGYNSDLAQYFKDVTSYGVSFEFRTF